MDEVVGETSVGDDVGWTSVSCIGRHWINEAAALLFVNMLVRGFGIEAVRTWVLVMT